MMNRILFKVKLFEKPNEKDNSRRRLLCLLQSLCNINELWLKIHPETPALYDSHVVYRIEKEETFRDIPTIIEDGEGDCDCLASWRVAELRDIGVKAHPYIKWRKEAGMWLYHAVVWLPGGKIEDPSLALGMGGGKIVRKPIYISP